MQPMPPCPAPTWQCWMQASALLLCWVSCCWVHNLWALIIYLFFLAIMLPSVIPRLTTDLAVSVSWYLETSLFLRLPCWDGAQSLPLLSLFLSFIFFPISFWRKWAAFLGAWCPLPAFRSCGIYWAFKCSFDEFVGKKVVTPSYSSAILGPPPLFAFFKRSIQIF